MCVHGLNVGVIARGTAGGREPVVLFLQLVWSLVTRDGDEDAHLRVPYLVACAISTSLTSSCSLAFTVDDFPRLPILSKLIGSTMWSTSLLASEYDSCGHRRCWTAASSCPYYSCRRRAKPVGIVLPCLRCYRTRCCALCFVDDDGRALYLGC